MPAPDAPRDRHPDHDDHPDPASEEAERPRGASSELEEGLDHLGRAVGGVLTRLLGPRYTRVELDPERPVLSPEADEALDRVGATMGRWLKATGDGLRQHPTDPVRVLDHVARHKDDEPVELREGEAPLAAGVRSLAGGLYRSTEAVLDIVAPRRPRPARGDASGDTAGEAAGDEPTTGADEEERR